MQKIIKAALFAFVYALAAPVAAQGFNAGIEAYQREDYAAALREWRPLAEQGNAKAQALLGAMYLNGLGVPRDYVQADMWYSLAASQGNESAIRGRKYLARIMTPAQIAEAEKLAREWRPK